MGNEDSSKVIPTVITSFCVVGGVGCLRSRCNCVLEFVLDLGTYVTNINK